MDEKAGSLSSNLDLLDSCKADGVFPEKISLQSCKRFKGIGKGGCKIDT